MRRGAALALSVVLASGLHAQGVQLTVLDPQPVQPGQSVTVQVTNGTQEFLGTGGLNDLVVKLRPDGNELEGPEIVGCRPAGFALAPGGVWTVSITAPAMAGTYLLIGPDGNTTLDVVAPSPRLPVFHAYPVAFHGAATTQRGHHVAFPPNQAPDWEIANVSATSQTLLAGLVNVYAPGGTTVLGSLNISSTTIPAHGAVQVTLPLAGLTPGPYTVETVIADPTGVLRHIRHGIQPASLATAVDMHFPEGRDVPRGGAIPVRLGLTGFNLPFFFSLPPPPTTVWYAIVLGFAPGSFPFRGSQVPISPSDPLLRASLVNGLGGVIANHLGEATITGVYCAHRTVPKASALGQIVNPNVPALTGLVLRAAAIGFDVVDRSFAASQPEEITIR